jgi:hypothetical protein
LQSGFEYSDGIMALTCFELHLKENFKAEFSEERRERERERERERFTTCCC